MASRAARLSCEGTARHGTTRSDLFVLVSSSPSFVGRERCGLLSRWMLWVSSVCRRASSQLEQLGTHELTRPAWRVGELASLRYAHEAGESFGARLGLVC